MVRYCCFLVLFSFSATLYAAPPSLVLEESTRYTQLFLHEVDIFEDTSGQLTLEDVVSSQVNFKPVSLVVDDRGLLNKGLTLSAFWIKIKIQNNAKKEDWYLTHWGGVSRQMQVYQRPALKDIFLKLKAKPARAIRYKIKIPYGATHDVYLRIQDKHTPLTLNPELQDAPLLIRRITTDYSLHIFVIGGLFILSLYNFIYFAYLKDYGFLLLSAFIFSFLMEMGNHAGMLNYIPFIKAIAEKTGSFFAFSTIAFAISLLYVWTDVPKNFPTLKTGFHDLLWASAGLAVISPFLPFSVAFAGGWSLLMIAIFSLYVIFFYRKGLRLPSSIVIGGSIFIISMLIPLLRGTDLIEDSSSLADFSFLGLLISLLFLSLTQAENVRLKGKKADMIVASSKVKDEFLATMSHELRTPMNAVVSAGRLLQMTALSNEQKEFVSRLGVSSQHMLSLINDILDLERINRNSVFLLEKIDFTLASVLDTLEQVLKEQANSKHLTLELNNYFIPLKKQLEGDPTRLKQILLNLLNNAIKFTHQGSVQLSITPLEVSEHHVSLSFEVRDTGIGISKEQEANLFQAFTQAESSTSRHYGGSGLGLAISHQLVQRMGGELQVQSTLGQGSRLFFTLEFPLTILKKSSQTIAVFGEKPPVSLEKFKVLLVDDDEMNRYFGGKLLKACGVNVAVAESGEDALQQVQTQTIDLVFMDVSMPTMDGYETTRRLRNDLSRHDLPIVALTAHAMTGIREQCLASGMDDYITKPFELEILASILKKWLVDKPMATKLRADRYL